MPALPRRIEQLTKRTDHELSDLRVLAMNERERIMKDPIEKKDWLTDRTIFFDGKGVWPKEIIIKGNKGVLRYRLIQTRAGKFQLVK